MDTLNHLLDRLVRPHFELRGRSYSAFTVCGSIGWVLAIGFALTLTATLGLSVTVTATLGLTAFVTFLALTMAVKMATGAENIVYYHHEVVVGSACALLLTLWHQPVLRYLDVVFMGLGLFLLCGRVGCLMVGCCHGRPHRWGVCYRSEHADAGFSHHLVGVRLFPIQLLEICLAATIITRGTFLLLTGAAPGSTLAWYSIAYGLGRFGFELLRGDPARPYFGPFSEAQWTTLVLMSATSTAELTGVLPRAPWHLVATALLALVMLVLALRERPIHRLLRPRHVQQLAELIAATRSGESAPGEIRIGETALGVRVSASTVHDAEDPVDVVALSATGAALCATDARHLTQLVRALQPSDEAAQLVERGNGVWHLVLAGKGQGEAHAV